MLFLRNKSANSIANKYPKLHNKNNLKLQLNTAKYLQHNSLITLLHLGSLQCSWLTLHNI